ncbi:hypothetical protein [Methylopila sp. M107]|uniref:hypothetical protein n=1 Tax=Methylopila sp. M107 TaxID=1101190 RepID=UPI0003767EF3|nr:hypothetical protein [Methylopila sp. M107]
MAVLNPQHLLQQAEKLVVPPQNGPPLQVDIRRAISAAYYAVFHAVLTAAADRYVGSTRRGDPEYGLLYRSVDHRRLKELCAELSKTSAPRRYQPYLPAKGMDGFSSFAVAVTELQEKRHVADYDPMVRLKTSDAKVAVSTARSALHLLQTMDAGERNVFLSLLVFPARP